MEVADGSDSDREDVWKMLDDDPSAVNGVPGSSEALKEQPAVVKESKD